MSTPATPGLSGALDLSGTATGYKPTLEDLRRLWTRRLVFANIPEKIEFEVGFDQWHEEELERASHDMPAELFNDLSEFLLHTGEHGGESLRLLDRLRERYGKSTRKRLGLD